MATRKISEAKYQIRAPKRDLVQWARAAQRLERTLGVRVSLAEFIRRTMNEATDKLKKTG